MIVKLRKAVGASRVKAATRQANKAAKVSGDVASKTGRGGGVLRKLAVSGAAGGAAGALSGGGGDDAAQAGGGGSPAALAAAAAKKAAANQDDPQIAIPEISVEKLKPVAERVDLTATNDVPVKVSVDPKTLVENYFDDKFEAIKAKESLIPAGTEIQGISNSIGAMAAQIAAIKALEETIQGARDDNARTKRANERRRDEADVESADPIADGVGNMLGAAGTMVGAYLSKFMVPAMLFGFAGMASAAQAAVGDDEETLGDIAEEFSWLDGIEEKYVQLTVALSTLGTSISQGFNAIKGNLMKKGADFVTKMANTNAAQKITSAGRGIVNAFAQTGKVLGANPVAGPFLQSLITIKGWFSKFAAGVAGPIKAVTQAMSTLPKFILKFFKGLLAKPAKYLIIFTAIDAMIDAALAFMFNSITAEEFHTRCKKNINDVLGLIAGTWITTIIFTAIGTAIGTVVPFFGNIAGAVLGVVMGVLFGEDLYKIIGLDDVVNALYDWIVLGDTTGLKNLGVNILESGIAHLKSVMAKYGEYIKSAVEAVSGEDKIASVESIEENYGKDASLTDIAAKQLDMTGTDEDALLYIADNIDSQAQLEQVNAELMDSRGMTLTQLARSELNDSEFEQFMTTLNASIEAGTPKPPEVKYDYPVTDFDGNIIGNFSTPEEAAEFAMQNNGIILNPREVPQEAPPSPPSAPPPPADAFALEEIEVTATKKDLPVFEIQDDEAKAIPVESATATVEAKKGDGVEVVSKEPVKAPPPRESTPKPKPKMSPELVERNRQIQMKRIEREIKRTEDVLSNNAMKYKHSMAKLDLVDLKRRLAKLKDQGQKIEDIAAAANVTLPDVSSTIKDKTNQVIAVTNQISGSGPREKGSVAGNQSKSQVESASPSFLTSDSFIGDTGLVT